MISQQLRPAFLMLLVLTVVTGVVYPLVVTGIAQVVFPHQANGGLIVIDGKAYGSELIGHSSMTRNISGVVSPRPEHSPTTPSMPNT